MALAILELETLERNRARFRIDTGSNRYYQLKVGRSVRKNAGIDWVDEVFHVTPVASNPAGGSLLDSHQDVSIPTRGFDKGDVYVQLFSFKRSDGTAPGYSQVISLQAGGDALSAIPENFALPSSIPMNGNATSFLPARRVPCCTGAEAYARQTSLDELLGSIAKVAVPMVVGLLGGGPRGAAPTGQRSAVTGVAAPSDAAVPGAVSASAAPGGTPSNEDISRLLNMIISGVVGAAGGNLSSPQSLLNRSKPGNRFSLPMDTGLSQAMIAPALLAFLGPLLDGVVKVLPGVVGPIAQNAPQMLRELNQHLPMLINSINQKQIQQKAADNKMATDMLSDVNRRMVLEEFLRSQQQATASGQSNDAAVLMSLLQMLQTPAVAAAPAPTTAPAADAPAAPSAVAANNVAVAHSLSAAPASMPSARAVLAFNNSAALLWNGSERLLYTRDRGVQFRLRLNVGEPVPNKALPKAILQLLFKDPADNSVILEKTFKQKDWAPNSELSFAFAPNEIAPLPLNRPLKVYARLRWQNSAGGGEAAALGNIEIILVEKYFIRQQGAAVSAERELNDMNRFRPFWNKVWEAPVMDGVGAGKSARVLWSLDVNARYSVLLSAEHSANGAMETRLLTEKLDPDDINLRTTGRLKGGIELGIAELNKLLPLWDGAPVLASDKLAAFLARPLASENALEFIYNMKLDGKAGQRGMVWVVPVFKLFEFSLGVVRDAGETGQVTGVDEEKVRFPLPVAARVIGLRAEH